MDDLKLIKKHYGEKMAHLCRELFPTILETEGLLYETLTKKFHPTKFLYDDIIQNNYISNFKNIIYGELEIKALKEKRNSKTPQELLDEAGYILYECKTYDDVKQFEKYYGSGEKLCTFGSINNRLNQCHVFFAVKKNVDEIKREEFKKPQRQDLYGTSVISIQFTKGKTNTLSIKNRYNHTVSNPDATFSNNLDNIIEGLTDAFEETYDLNINATTTTSELPGYVLASDKKLYKYNFERFNAYFCPDNIIIDHNNADNQNIKKYDKSRYIVFDNFILDMQEKTIKEYIIYEDGLLEVINDIKSIKVINNKELKEKTIIINDSIELTINDKSQLIRYRDYITETIPHKFLKTAYFLREIDLPNAITVKNNVLEMCSQIEKISMPKVKIMGNDFLCSRNNRNLKKVDLPNVNYIGENFLATCENVNEISLPKVKKIDNSFMCNNKMLTHIELPELEEVKSNFLNNNRIITSVYLPKLVNVGGKFLALNMSLTEIELPSAKYIWSNFMSSNVCLSKINLPNVIRILDSFLNKNEYLTELSLPNVEEIGVWFLSSNKSLRKLDIPKCKIIEGFFLVSNKNLENFDLPNVTSIGNDFIRGNENLKSISMPNVKYIGKDFLVSNVALEELEIPNIEEIENSFLIHNRALRRISLPKVKHIGDWFLHYNKTIKTCNIHVPQLKSISIYKTLRENLDVLYELETLAESNNKGKKKNNKQKKKLQK